MSCRIFGSVLSLFLILPLAKGENSEEMLLLLLLSGLASSRGLSTTSLSPSSPQPIEKVAIIGSGIAGLSLAHALVNSKECSKTFSEALGDGTFNLEAHLFDSRPSLNYGAGAGIQLTGGKLKSYFLSFFVTR